MWWGAGVSSFLHVSGGGGSVIEVDSRATYVFGGEEPELGRGVPLEEWRFLVTP
jgi:hypothetical protein